VREEGKERGREEWRERGQQETSRLNRIRRKRKIGTYTQDLTHFTHTGIECKSRMALLKLSHSWHTTQMNKLTWSRVVYVHGFPGQRRGSVPPKERGSVERPLWAS